MNNFLFLILVESEGKNPKSRFLNYNIRPCLVLKKIYIKNNNFLIIDFIIKNVKKKLNIITIIKKIIYF